MAVAMLELLSLCGRGGWKESPGSLCCGSGPGEHSWRSGLAQQLLQGHLFLTPWCEMLLFSLSICSHNVRPF